MKVFRIPQILGIAAGLAAQAGLAGEPHPPESIRYAYLKNDSSMDILLKLTQGDAIRFGDQQSSLVVARGAEFLLGKGKCFAVSFKDQVSDKKKGNGAMFDATVARMGGMPSETPDFSFTIARYAEPIFTIDSGGDKAALETMDGKPLLVLRPAGEGMPSIPSMPSMPAGAQRPF